jgi:hypothetical protein
MRNDTPTGAGGRGKRRDRFVIVWWTLAMVGGLLLIRASWLPWVTNSVGDMTISINGFNGAADENILPWAASGDNTDQFSSPDDGTVPDLPSLSSISLFSGGTDSSAESGILVLTAGATALFMTLWTLWGDIERRRNMARVIVVLGGLTLIVILRDLFNIRARSSSFEPHMVGYGVFVGLGGAAAITIGAGLLYWTIRVHPQE